MFHFFRHPALTLDCFTYDEAIAKGAPITLAANRMPTWWKELPSELTIDDMYYPTATMRKCRGFIDYYTKSVAIPMWSDLAISIGKDRSYEWQYSDNRSTANVHRHEQRGSFLPFTEYGHLKVDTPWVFKTKQSVDWVFSYPTYNFSRPEQLIIAPGVLNFKAQPVANINMFFDTTVPHSFIIPYNTVLAHITPLTDKKINVKRHVVDKQEYDRLKPAHWPVTFTNTLSTFLNASNKFSNCPYNKKGNNV